MDYLAALQGQIVREFMYVYHESQLSMKEIRERAEDIAKGWGFDYEMKAIIILRILF